MRKALILLAILAVLAPSSVYADELWVRNEGGLEVTVWSDSDWQDVTATVESGIIAVGPCDPSEVPESGKAKIATATLEGEWVIIEAENITDYRIDVACNQDLEDIVPESYIVKDALTWEEFVEEYGEMPPPPPDASNTDVWLFDTPTFEPMGDYSDGGQSVADMNAEKEALETCWAGQEYWLWT